MGMIVLLLWASFSEAGAIFLTIQNSAQMVAMGYTGAARWEDPSARYLNPAAGVFQPGQSFTTLNTSTFSLADLLSNNFLKEKGIQREPNWLLDLAHDMFHHYWEVGMSQDFKNNIVRKISIRISGTRLNLGTVDAYDENGNYLGSWKPYDRARSANLSVLLPYGFSVGYTLKDVYSFLAPREIMQIVLGIDADAKARTYTQDYGVLWNSNFGISLGAAIHNDGGIMDYIKVDSSFGDPLPKYLRYGYTFRFHELFKWVTGESLAPFFTFTYSEDRITDRVGTRHETWYGWGYEVGLMNLLFFRNGYFVDREGLRIGPTEGWGIRLGAISLDVANDGKIYEFSFGPNWWISLSLQTPKEEGIIDRVLGKKAMGWLQAILFPGAGHIYEGNPRGLVYATLSTALYTASKRGNRNLFLAGASLVYLGSLVDYYLWR